MDSHKPSYFKEYFSDKDVGALHPSSRFLVRRLIGCLRPSAIRTIVEFGPGPGIATRPILEALPEGARYIAIEKNPVFLAALKASITDPRLSVVGGDACSVREILASRGIEAVDAIIASLPFSFLTKQQRAGLLEDVGALLADDGDFVIFHQFSLMMRPLARKNFPRVRTLFEPRNIMPCFLLHCRKKP
ncbi:MAG: rRNA adenine N-6-methyltransferase family protein, partial [Acidobacteriota bacterium]